MHPHDIHAGGTETHLPPDFRWPGGRRLAVFFRVAFEWWSDGKWPGVGPMGNPLAGGSVDINALGFAEYGHRRGIPRAMDALTRHGVRATVLVSGIMAERHPEIVRDLGQAGHELVAHSYAMDIVPVYLDETAERDNIRRTTDLIEAASGRRPEGWVSPRGTPSVRTPRLLAAEGYTWHGDTLNDDLPYKVDFGAGQSIVAFPGNMEVNDLPVYMRHGNSPRQLMELYEDWFEYARDVEKGPARLDPTIHSHVFGRPIGMAVFEKMMAHAQASDAIWTGTRGEAVAHIRQLGIF
ncbi:MAG: polysaccharide deacetylase family protein [Burkholderiales bacterium]|nr:polysaccharide deacetylase family protein [Burkholderiales bacterium]